ncbi:MAG: 7TM diverse intracellular signaling domain-containing protein [Chitinophagales bacterium]
MKKTFIILILLNCRLISFAKGAIDNVYALPDDVGARTEISNYAKIFVDSNNSFSLEHILAGNADNLFHENSIWQSPWKNHPAINVWGKLFLYNPSDRPREIYIALERGDITNVYFGSEKSQLTKITFGFSLREKTKIIPAIRIKVPAGDTVMFYFQSMQDDYFIYNGPHVIQVSEVESLWKLISKERLFYGIFYGIVIALIFYSIALFIAVRESIYLYFIFFLLFMGLYFVDHNRIGQTYIWNYPFFHNLEKYGNGYVFSTLASVSAFLFFRKFMNLKNEFPRFDKIFVLLIALTVINYFGIITGNAAMWRTFMNYLLLVLQLVTVVLSIILSFRKSYTAKIFLVAFTIPLICAILNQVWILNHSNHFKTIGQYLFQAGAGLAFITFSIGVGINIRRMNRQKRKAEAIVVESLKENERLIKEQNIILEQKVEERTKELKKTQQQLIQNEKLASLGQLTAGIAHEIKNPLNFVINFSQLSNELITEFQDAKSEEDKNMIITDLRLNLQKINEHGKRADSIVKNMLQHSRGESAEKELTDINKLCEEFFLLAYHGMRASDPEFNCTLNKQLNPALPQINVVSQDISRVLLNLFNNAFYAVNKRSKIELNGYIPEVKLVTEKNSNNIVIRVTDNGTGIPVEIKEKIFNPFFTTKSTGEGTGLGLSISHDIIVGHGGELTVVSEQNNFTEFRILLPII